MTKQLSRMIFVLAGLLAAGTSAFAHPHVWVTVQGELVYAPDGTATGVRYNWTFDDMFSAFATQGLDAKKPGQFTREELAPIAKIGDIPPPGVGAVVIIIAKQNGLFQQSGAILGLRTGSPTLGHCDSR